MKVGRQDLLYKWIMDELPQGVSIAVKGVPAAWSDDHFVLTESGQTLAYGNYKLKDITVNGLDVRQFHNENGTCQELPEWIAKPVEVVAKPEVGQQQQ